ncbi:MAG: hypothetical protein ACR2II_06070 [Chthoniobacterales bacterium]
MLSLLVVSCSEKSEPDSDGKPARPSVAEEKSESDAKKEVEESAIIPESQEIGEDCVAFLRATTAVPINAEKKDCPECPSGNAAFEVLKFNTFKIDKISPSGSACEVLVEIHAEFNPSPGGTIVGGLTGWITPEQKEKYARGETPAGVQIYKVKITYTRKSGFWKAIEFDRGDRP